MNRIYGNDSLNRVVEKPWGSETIWAETDRYVGKVLFIRKRHRLSKQYHEKKEETIRVRIGILLLSIFAGEEEMQIEMMAKDVYHIPPGTVHRMTALTDCWVDEVSSPELDDVVRLEDDYNR